MMYSPLRFLPSVVAKRRPIHLTFFVTRRCNAKCPFCFYLRSADDVGNVAEELSVDEIRKVSRSLGRLLWIAFSGGEIFLRGDLVEVSKVFYEQNKPSFMLYPTNGMMPELIRDQTERILRHCRKSAVVVKVSLDGLKNTHDALRDTPGSFERAMKTHRLLGKLLDRYANFELGINTVFCSGNQDEMDDIIDFVDGLDNGKTHTISLIRGNLLDPRFKDVDFGKYAHAIGRLEQELKNKTADIYHFWGARLKAAQDIVQRRLIHQTALAKKRLLPCYSGRLNLVLRESGDVYPCEMLTETLGNVRNHGYDIRKLIGSERAAAVLDFISANRCHCTNECHFITNILFNPRQYPALLKEYLQL